ncbi:MAG TPA: YicC family protein [Bacillota bacterium]|nr:YicC family protein [Bacillota bacterium]HOA15842.1 YicC family protein [Bacillota bacterium]
MPRSMTGYGRGEAASHALDILVEVKAVNNKFLDSNIRLPKELSALEDRLRKMVTANLDRGKIDMFITVDWLEGAPRKVVVDKALAKAYHEAMTELAAEIGMPDDIGMARLASFPDVISVKDVPPDIEQIWEVLREAAQKALEALVAMRESEGRTLVEDLKARIATVSDRLSEVEVLLPEGAPAYREKLMKKLEEIRMTVDEARFAQEAALMAEKCDCTEETVRLRSHISQFKGMLDVEGPIGRKMDFLVQEMNRETNTIGSKSQDVRITGLVLELKSEIEKIREQIQNIE